MSFNISGGDGEVPLWPGYIPAVTVRPTSFLSVSGGLDWFHEVQDAQWIRNTDDGRYVFGRLDQKTLSLTARVNYTITPQLTVQVYAAPFVSAGGYSSFNQLVNGRADRHADRYSPIP